MVEQEFTQMLRDYGEALRDRKQFTGLLLGVKFVLVKAR